MSNLSSEDRAEIAQQIEDEIIRLRAELVAAIKDAANGVRDALTARDQLAGNEVYDVEHAEGRQSAALARFLSTALDALTAAEAIAEQVHR